MWVTFDLSRAAEADLLHIYRTGFELFGFEQAERYQDGLERTFAFLAEFPRAARLRPELNRDTRAHPYRSHIVFYRIDGDRIVIQRIRHSREDWIGNGTG